MAPEQEPQPIMQVAADIRRSDLLVFNLYVLPRIKLLWVLFSFMTALYFLLFFAFGDRHDIAYLAYGAAYCALFAAVVVGLLVLYCVAQALFRASVKNGQLGTHVFTLRKEGFHEQTSLGEMLNRWQGIHSITAWKQGLYIRINWYLFHVIPASAFASRADFDKFSGLALELWAQAKKSA